MASTSWFLSGNAGTNPASNFLGTTDTEPLVVKTGGAERLRVDTNGNVGIATTNPGHPLHLAVGKTLRIEGGTSASDNADYFSFGGNGNFGIDAPGIPNGRFAVLNSGSVGIGAANPYSQLHLRKDIGGGALGPSLTLMNGAGGAGAGASIDFDGYDPGNANPPAARIQSIDDGDYSSHIAFLAKTPGAVNNRLVENLRINSNGNVGIGTSSPASKLDINGFVNATGLNIGGLSVDSQGNVGIALDQYDVQRDGEPLSPLVVHGDIRIKGSGNLRVFGGDVLLEGADCAEDFDAAGEQLPDPGSVVVIDESGALRESTEAYDKKVAGIVSGAGEYRHGLVLDKRTSDEGRIPVALMGKVFCKVDAQYSPIEVGDLLTSSPTPGHAMKAMDSLRAFGCVMAKALRPLREGRGMIPVLIALQ